MYVAYFAFLTRLSSLGGMKIGFSKKTTYNNMICMWRRAINTVVPGWQGTKVAKAQWSGHQGSKPTLLHPTPAEPRRAGTRMSRVEPRHELWYGTGLGGPKYRAGFKVYVLCERGRKKSRDQSTGLGGTKVPGWEGPKYRAGGTKVPGWASRGLHGSRARPSRPRAELS